MAKQNLTQNGNIGNVPSVTVDASVTVRIFHHDGQLSVSIDASERLDAYQAMALAIVALSNELSGTCEMCGRELTAKATGPKPRYCSQVCRTAFSRARRSVQEAVKRASFPGNDGEGVQS